jgi:hypothetical protein
MGDSPRAGGRTIHGRHQLKCLADQRFEPTVIDGCHLDAYPAGFTDIRRPEKDLRRFFDQRERFSQSFPESRAETPEALELRAIVFPGSSGFEAGALARGHPAC